MVRSPHWLLVASTLAILVGLTPLAVGAEAISAGKVKSVNADKKEFVLTDGTGKDATYKLGDNVVINRGGKESKTDVTAGDAVNVLYDKGLLSWTARYILVQTGDSKDWTLMHGTFKNYDPVKMQLSFTDAGGKDMTFGWGGADVRLNMKLTKVGDIKIGDKTVAIVEKKGDKTTLKSVMVERKQLAGLSCHNGTGGQRGPPVLSIALPTADGFAGRRPTTFPSAFAAIGPFSGLHHGR